MRKIINEFRGKYGFLSNFYHCNVEFENMMFESSENAFQAAKIKYNDIEKTMKAREAFIGITATEAKQMGKQCELRSDWEQVKDQIMLDIVTDKFNRNSELKEELLATDDTILIESTKWHDNYWGNCSCSKCKSKKGLNKLGNILMEVRKDLA